MMLIRTRIALRTALISGLFTVATSWALGQIVIPITDASFETPATNSFINTPFPGWTSVGAQPTVYNYAAYKIGGDFNGIGAPAGLQVGAVDINTSIYQDLTGYSLISGATYVLSGYIGERISDPSSTGAISLYTTGGTLLATTGYQTAPLGGFQLYSVTFTPNAQNAYLGQTLRIQLDSGTNGQPGNAFTVPFDAISLTATAIPEPATEALLAGLGAVGLMGLKRFRRRR